MKYVVDARLGVGGMAEVFRARLIGASGFSRLVAIKRMNAALSGDESFVRMFGEEARTAGLLLHANIVQVIYFDQDESGALFLAMELVDGPDLFKLTELVHGRGARLPFSVSAYIMAEALRGLGFAHEYVHEGQPLRIVHRDVSPQNILIDRAGAVKIADFGIAKMTASAAGRHTGGIKGKLAYMAPEQANAQPLDARADLYAIGVILYELLAGARAFTGATETDILMKVLLGDVTPLSEQAPDVPADLVAIVTRLMSRDPDQRFPTAAATAEAIRACSCFPDDGAGELARLLAMVLPPIPSAAPASPTPVPVSPASSAPMAVGSVPSAPMATPPPALVQSFAPMPVPPMSSAPMPVPAMQSRPMLAPQQPPALLRPSQPASSGSNPFFEIPADAPVMPATLVLPAERVPGMLEPARATPAPFAATPSVPSQVHPPLASPGVEPGEASEPAARMLRWLVVLLGVAILAAVVTRVVFVRSRSSARTAAVPGIAEPQREPEAAGPPPAVPNEVAPPKAEPAPEARADVVAVVPDAGSGDVTVAGVATRPRGSDEHGEPGTLVVRVIPWAQVLVDGKPAGTTPLTRKLPPGVHRVKLVNEELGKKEAVTVTIGSKRELVLERNW
jgi:serine/threonine protein kinase